MVKEKVKSQKLQTQNIQEIWNNVKRGNLRIVRTEGGKESQLKGTENNFNKIIKETFPYLKKERPTKVQEAFRTPNNKDQKIKFPSK